MTIASQVNRVSYTGNGVTTAFPVSFPFQTTSDLVVIETTIATGVQTTQILDTDYTISGTPDSLGHYPNGGSVDAVSPPAGTATWTIYRDPALTQSVDLVEGDPLPVESALESPLDKLTMITQRLNDRLNRTLQQPEGDSANIIRLPAKITRAGKVLAFDTNGDPTVIDPFTGASFLLTDTATGTVYLLSMINGALVWEAQ